jgi:hypothetical protein
MRSSMLNYCKKILKSVSFDKELFEKELKKAVRNLLLNDEVMALRKWCLRKFSNSYKQIIKKVFSEFNSQQKLPV